jgi:hypothetical protein
MGHSPVIWLYAVMGHSPVIWLYAVMGHSPVIWLYAVMGHSPVIWLYAVMGHSPVIWLYAVMGHSPVNCALHGESRNNFSCYYDGCQICDWWVAIVIVLQLKLCVIVCKNLFNSELFTEMWLAIPDV